MNVQYKAAIDLRKILIGPTTLCHTYAILCISCAIALIGAENQMVRRMPM